MNAAPPAGGVIDRISIVVMGAGNLSLFTGCIGARETLAVEGWALDGLHESVADGAVLTLGDSSSVAEYGRFRPDVALAFANTAFAKCGFHGVIAPTPGSEGILHLRVFAIGRDGGGFFRVGDAVNVKIVPATLRPSVTKPSRHGFATYCIDRGDGERLHRGETLSVIGWSYDQFSLQPMRGAFLVIDDADIVYGAVGLSRPDVAASLGDDAPLQAGFIIRFDTWGLAPGRHRLRLGFIAHDGIAHESFELARGLEILPPHVV